VVPEPLGQERHTLAPEGDGFLNFKTATVSLTGTAYRKLPYGPAPSDYGLLLDQMETQGLLICQEVEYPRGYTGFNYQRASEEEGEREALRLHEHTGRPLGDARFLAKLERLAVRVLRPRKPGPKKKAKG